LEWKKRSIPFVPIRDFVPFWSNSNCLQRTIKEFKAGVNALRHLQSCPDTNPSQDKFFSNLTYAAVVGTIRMRKPAASGPYLILKANASHIPLKDGSVDMVLATPPYIGARPVGRGAFCTNSPREYKRMIDTFLTEALRVVKAEGYILMSTSRTPAERRPGAVKVIFRSSANERIASNGFPGLLPEKPSGRTVRC
jgi:hypothetical protein